MSRNLYLKTIKRVFNLNIPDSERNINAIYSGDYVKGKKLQIKEPTIKSIQESIMNSPNPYPLDDRYKIDMNSEETKLLDYAEFKRTLIEFSRTYINAHNINLWMNPNDLTDSVDDSPSKKFNESFTTENYFKNDVVYGEKIIIPKAGKIYFVGDIHSSLHSFWTCLINMDIVNDELIITDPNNYLIFTGDIVDRGPYSIELLYIIFNLRIKNPKQVFICNGNHEDMETYYRYGMREEFVYQFEKEDINLLNQALYFLPSVIFAKYEDEEEWYQFSHGMLDIKNLEKTKEMMRYHINHPKKFLESEFSYWLIDRYDPLNGYKWVDFSNYENNSEIIFIVSDNEFCLDISLKEGKRGIVINENILSFYQKYNNIKTIISGHQDMENSLFFSDDKSLQEDIIKFQSPENNEYVLDGFITDNKKLTTPFNFTSTVIGIDKLKIIKTSTASTSRMIGYATYGLISFHDVPCGKVFFGGRCFIKQSNGDIITCTEYLVDNYNFDGTFRRRLSIASSTQSKTKYFIQKSQFDAYEGPAKEMAGGKLNIYNMLIKKITKK